MSHNKKVLSFKNQFRSIKYTFRYNYLTDENKIQDKPLINIYIDVIYVENIMV